MCLLFSQDLHIIELHLTYFSAHNSVDWLTNSLQILQFNLVKLNVPERHLKKGIT